MKAVLIVIIGAFILGGVSAVVLVSRTQRAPIPTPLPQQTVAPSPSLALVMANALAGQLQLKSSFGVNTGTTSARLVPGDVVSTDEHSVVEIVQGNEVVLVAPASTLTLTQSGSVTSFSQAIGAFYARIKKVLGVGESFEIATPSLLAAVRGTEFGLVSSMLDTLLIVDEGTVSARIASASAVKVTKSQLLRSREGSVSATLTFSASESAWFSFAKSSERASGAAKFVESYYLLQHPIPSPSPLATPTPRATPTPVASIKTITQMLGEGYQVGSVKTDVGTYTLSCMGASKSTTKVVTDSANESDCKNDCPVKPLAEYVSANGGFAGLNGMYFCPPDYPACADKKNTYDTLFFNSRVKRYINSDNNVYSTIPFLVVFNDSSTRFVSHAQDWGRDTGIAAGTAGNPLLIRDHNNVVGEYSLDDKQRNTKSNRGAFVENGGLLYLCIVKSATVPDSAVVYKALNVDNAINIDGGGSSALYVNGAYKFGPGRALPTAIIFARK